MRSDHVLLVRRARPPRTGEWSLPGGLQKLGETVAEAARREVLEETGLTIRVLGLADVVDLIEPDDDAGIRYHYTLVDVVASVEKGRLRAGDDAADACWFPLETLSKQPLWDETRRVIALAHRVWSDAGAP